MTGKGPIPGGFILLSRKLLKCGIMEESALHLKLWIWMLLETSHKDHGKLKRGQFFASYKRMQKAMARKIGWRTEKPTIDEIRGVMKTLMKAGMITTMKVYHGMIITILKYEYYQDMRNYGIGHDSRNDPHNDPTISNKEGLKEYKYSCRQGAEGDHSCPYNQILDLYHKILTELPVVRKMTDRRKRMLRARWNEKAKSPGLGLRSNTLEFWEALFKYIRESDWLMGRKSEWRANFEWIITKCNFYKIIEKHYHNA